jgi:beta-glucoside operon transcriptional antiterminator
MRVVKVLNNNIVLTVDDGVLAVIVGYGVGFNHKKGDNIEFQPDFQKFVFQDINTPLPTASNATPKSVPHSPIQKNLELLQNVPPEILAITAKIMANAKNNLPRKFSETVFYSLADHLNFAIERKMQGLDLHNALSFEIRAFYPDEYEIANQAVQIIKESLKIEFPDDEKSFIAMHFVNAELGEDLPQTLQITEIISDVSELIKKECNFSFNVNTLSYFRFVTHIKFFAQRILRDEQVIEQPDDTLFDMVKNEFPNFYNGAKAIQYYIEKNYGKEVSNQELAYLTIHLKRVIDASTENEQPYKPKNNE